MARQSAGACRCWSFLWCIKDGMGFWWYWSWGHTNLRLNSSFLFLLYIKAKAVMLGKGKVYFARPECLFWYQPGPMYCMCGWTRFHLIDKFLLWHSLLILFPYCVSVLSTLSFPVFISTLPIQTAGAAFMFCWWRRLLTFDKWSNLEVFSGLQEAYSLT